MPPPSNKPPRFIPTLTEVIGSGEPVRAASEEPKEGSRPRKVVAARPQVSEELVDRVLQRLQPMLEAQLRESVTSLVQEHASMLELLLSKEIEQQVRQTVAQVLTQELRAAR